MKDFILDIQPGFHRDRKAELPPIVVTPKGSVRRMKQAHSLVLSFFALVAIASVFKTLRYGRFLPASLESKGDASGVRKLGFGQDRLRVAVFGGANAWGVGLENRFKAYPYLLSPTVDNFAHTSMGPNYYSVCAETVIGDDALYDVIVLDYWLRYFEGLDQLAGRLRARYPNAIMIFVRNWVPVHFRRKETEESKGSQSIDQWKRENGLGDADLKTIIESIEKDVGYWYLPTRDKADASIWQTAQRVKGYEFSFTQRETGKQTLLDFLGYFDEKHHSHVSELGHEAIANALQQIVKTHLKNGVETELVNSGINGDWGGGDSCNLWYFTGGTKMLYGGMEMRQFDEKNGLFGLEVVAPAWLTVSNPLTHDALPTRTLYVSYLTSKDEGYYPNAEITIGDATTTLRTLNTVDPNHAVRTVALGQVGHGYTNMTCTTVGEGSNPFRLVGVAFSDEAATPLEWSFGPTQGSD